MAQKRGKGYKRKQNTRFDGVGSMVLMGCAILMLVCTVMFALSDEITLAVVCGVLLVVFVGVSQYLNGNYNKR